MGKQKSSGLTYRAYAKHRNVSPEAVSKAVKTGRITAGPDGKIDAKKADKEWAENTDISKPRNSVTGNPKMIKIPDSDIESAADALSGSIPSYMQSRAVREAYQARLAKLEYEIKKGKLVDSTKVSVAAFNAARAARDKILNLPDRLAPSLAMRSVEEIHTILHSELRLLCDEIAIDACRSS